MRQQATDASTLQPGQQSPKSDDLAPPDVTIDDVRAAAERIRAYIRRTPVFESATLNERAGVHLGIKAENLQRTGSFKVRGALNAVLGLDADQRRRGVITLSAGNHGQALAYAARSAGVRCVVFMPEDAVPVKVAAVRGYGGEARFAPSMQTLFPAMEEYRLEQGLHFVHPFGDPAVIAGQGTVGLELFEDYPDAETVCVPVGGGGLLAGVAVVARALKPAVTVVGVEPDGAAAVSKSLAAGHPITLDTISTVADGLAAPFAAPVSQRLIERHVDSVITIDDDTIVAGMKLILERMKLLVEPAGAAAVAALVARKVQVRPGSRVVAVATGGNIDFEKLKRLL